MSSARLCIYSSSLRHPAGLPCISQRSCFVDAEKQKKGVSAQCRDGTILLVTLNPLSSISYCSINHAKNCMNSKASVFVWLVVQRIGDLAVGIIIRLGYFLMQLQSSKNRKEHIIPGKQSYDESIVIWCSEKNRNSQLLGLMFCPFFFISNWI